ncbi:MAG TPA: DUF3857 and transglutaminase domain-containing protein, partial [Rhizomicrobium sp.]
MRAQQAPEAHIDTGKRNPADAETKSLADYIGERHRRNFSQRLGANACMIGEIQPGDGVDKIMTKAIGRRWLFLAGMCATLPAAAQTAPDNSEPPLRIKQFRDEIVVDAQGRTDITATTALQILRVSPTGPAGQLPVNYNAGLEDVQISNAYTQKADGRKIPVDPAAILTQHAPAQGLAPVYTDIEQKVIIFPNVEAGDTLVYTERRRSKEPIISGQFMMANYPSQMLAVDDSQYTLRVPKSMSLHVDSKDMNQRVTQEGDQTVYRWSFSNSKAQPRPTSPVPRPDTKPHFRISSLADYDELGHAYAPLALDKIVVTPAIQKQADAITQGIADPKAQARALYDWVSQHIRYVAIELGVGGFVPHDPDWTLTNAYGDC